MRHSRLATLLLVPALVFGLAVPSAATGAEHTDFYGVYFPAGLPGTNTACPGNWVGPALCVIDPGSWTVLPSGRHRIRDMTVYELAFAWSEGQVEPRKTGYDIVVANANLDASLSGPAWGTWNLYSSDHVLMFTGTFTGKFENGIPAVRFVGEGTGIYEGQHMRGDVGRVPDPYNMFGQIVAPAS